MMRYSEIARDLSADSLRFVEQSADEYIYKNLREESPPSEVSNYNGGQMRNKTVACNQHQSILVANNQINQINNNNNNNHNSSSTNYVSIKNSNRKNRSSCGNSNRGVSSGGDGIVLSSPSGCVRQRMDGSKSCGNVKEREFDKEIATKPISTKSSRRKNSIGSACLNAMSTSPNSGCYYCYSSPPPPTALTGKTQSLPSNSTIKNYDSVILNALRVSAEELANQITLLDFPIFAAIQPDELTSCAWTKKDKHVVTPNIVAFTKRFNHTSFWTVQEILSGDQPKQRAEILTHFIKVAKKLYELNNLHSLFAIVSAMQSASIYRLKKTWSCLSKKDKQTFDRLSDVFSDRNNWENLREYLESLRLPCIPYLGLFLTDLIYIDLAHPHSGGLEPDQRRNKMNNILRVISNYQQSDYGHIQPMEVTQKYLQSIRYIEELQNIFEDDQYKKSLILEPSSPSGPSSSSCSSKESFNVDAVAPALACLNLSPAKTIGSMRITTNASKFIPGHRKCRSLGSNIFGKVANLNHDAMMTAASPGCGVEGGNLSDDRSDQPRHLLDDSVLENCQTTSDDISTSESTEGVLCHLECRNEAGGGASNIHWNPISLDYSSTNCIQGCVRRKTVQKEGRKPAVASWQRYWLQVWANSLVYFPPKSFKGCDRADFKREPCKICPLDGWSAQVIDNPKHKNSFELFNPMLGTIYKFRTDSLQATQQWTNTICKVAAHRSIQKPPLPVNLMSFE